MPTEGTRGIAATSALENCASLADICRTGGWATPNTFARFYDLHMKNSFVSSLS